MAGPQVDFARLAGVLFGVTLCSAMGLAIINGMTKPRIDAIAKEKAILSRKGVLPKGTASVDDEAASFLVDLGPDWGQNAGDLQGILNSGQEAARKIRVFRGYDEAKEVTGYALSCELPDGYSGKIGFMVGMSYDQDAEEFKVSGSSILSHAETPGLGANIVHLSYSEKQAAKAEGRPPVPGYLQQYVGKGIEEVRLKKEDPPGPLDALTAATITSKAYTQAVRRVLAMANRNTDAFLNPPVPAATPEAPSHAEGEGVGHGE